MTGSFASESMCINSCYLEFDSLSCCLNELISCIKVSSLDLSGKCDICGGTLLQREDDTLEALKQRLKAYHELTKPVIDYYENKGLVSKINADQSPEEVFDDIKKVLEAI